MDYKGQIAMEYLLLFFVFIIVLSIITIPLIINAIESSNEIITTIETKSLLLEIQRNIKMVYTLDVDSKRSFSVYVPCDIKLFYGINSEKKYLSTSLTYSDNSRKALMVEVPCEVSFNGYTNNRYVLLKKSWYYNVEVSHVTFSNGKMGINVNFK